MSNRKNIYNNIEINREDKLVPVTAYIPLSAKLAIKQVRTSMSHFIRTGILRKIKEKNRQRERQKFRYHNDKEFRKSRLENARRQKRK